MPKGYCNIYVAKYNFWTPKYLIVGIAKAKVTVE